MMSLSRRLLSVGLVLGLGALAACEDDGPTTPDLGQVQTVTVAPASTTSLTVSFDAVAGAQSYEIQRGQGLAPATFATVTSVTTTSHTDTGLQANSDYTYRVFALRGTERGAYGQASGRTSAVAATPVREITADITASRTFFRDTIYRLGTFIKVSNGATLTIQDGTRIEGEENSALFILRGAKIDARGTAERPIVFTSAKAVGERRAGDWGGLVLLGNGIINRTGNVILEGTGTSGTNPQQNYAGGTDNADNSGILSYVRIEFAGFGPATDAELNSLTMAAVGSGTQIDHVQTLYGLDDSFEWFGGAVDARYLVSYESGDDHFDAAEGYVGRNQFLIAFQSVIPTVNPGAGGASNDPQGFEIDGCADSNTGTCGASGQNAQPYTLPMFANFTVVGAAAQANIPQSGGFGLVVRRGAGGYFVNGVIARWRGAAISLRDLTSTQLRATEGNLVLRNILVAENGAMFQPGATNFALDSAANEIRGTTAATAALFSVFPATTSVDTRGTAFDWRPATASAASQGGTGAFTGAIATRGGTFVTGTAYRGAVAADGARWWEGWTHYAQR
jgi:hypothetical protein